MKYSSSEKRFLKDSKKGSSKDIREMPRDKRGHYIKLNKAISTLERRKKREKNVHTKKMYEEQIEGRKAIQKQIRREYYTKNSNTKKKR